MKKISLILLLFFVFSCTKLGRLSKIENEIKDSNDFNDILALKYLRYSYVLKKNYDFESSSYFAGLGLDAYKKNKKFSLTLDESMKDLKPEVLADIYFLFNCWLYFETNNKNLGEATICKDSFIKLTTLLEKNKNISLYDKLVNAENDSTKFLTKEEELYFIEFSKNKVIDIYFDFDNYKLNPESITKISAILKYVNNLKNDYKISIIGHADRIGKSIYNNTIARRRVNTVYNVLVKNGIPVDLINVTSESSKNPKVLTRRTDKNQLNRRVEVIIKTDYKSMDINPQPFKKLNVE